MPVYADVLAAVNGFVSFLLLETAAKILKISSSGFRMFISSAMGGLFSLVIFLPEFTFFADIAVKMLMCVLMARAAFGFGGVKRFIRNSAVFFTVSVLYGGLMSAIFNLTGFGGMIYKNGTAYFDISVKTLAVMSVICFAVLNLIMRFARSKAPPHSIFDVEIKADGRSCRGRGLADTGNSLCEIFSGAPVIVAHIRSAGKVMPREIREYLASGDPDNLNENIRLIPSATVAGSALLPAFRADEVIIRSPQKLFIYNNVYIAVCRNEFFGGEFEFLINSSLTEGSDDERFDRKNKKADIKTHRERYPLHKRTRDSAGAADKAAGNGYFSKARAGGRVCQGRADRA